MPLRQEPSPRFKLKALAKRPRRLSRLGCDTKLTDWAADSIENYLSGKSKSLNAAFGLQKKRGTPGWPKARLKQAKAVYALRKAGHSWNSVLDELSKRGFGDLDLGTVKRTYKEFLVRLASRDIAQNLDQDGDLFLPTKTRKTQSRR